MRRRCRVLLRSPAHLTLVRVLPCVMSSKKRGGFWGGRWGAKTGGLRTGRNRSWEAILSACKAVGGSWKRTDTVGSADRQPKEQAAGRYASSSANLRRSTEPLSGRKCQHFSAVPNLVLLYCIVGPVLCAGPSKFLLCVLSQGSVIGGYVLAHDVLGICIKGPCKASVPVYLYSLVLRNCVVLRTLRRRGACPEGLPLLQGYHLGRGPGVAMAVVGWVVWSGGRGQTVVRGSVARLAGTGVWRRGSKARRQTGFYAQCHAFVPSRTWLCDGW